MLVEELLITMEISLLIDVKKERVILAESNSDFIDVLFSFLTLPLGTIVRILEKQSSLGFMDRLYESVQKLDIDYFSTEACKTMLLAPRSVSDLRCEDLKLRPDDSYPRSIYICKTPDCFYNGRKPCSREAHTVCSQCGRTMTRYYSSIDDRIAGEFHVDKELKDHINFAKEKKEENIGGVFVVKGGRFLVTDDLYVMQSSTKNTLAEMKKHGIENFDSCPLEQRRVTLQRSTVLDILKNSLAESKTVLTNVFLKERKLEQNGNGVVISRNISPLFHLRRKSISKEIIVKLQWNKTNDDIVYVEAGADLVDYLFSFLTLTLGAVVNLLDGVSGIGSIDNLYQSVRELHYLYKCIKSEQCLWELTLPIVASHYRCDNQLLEIREEDYWLDLRALFPRGAAEMSKMILVDPKSPVGGSKGGGRFMKRSNKFLVAEDMGVYPFSSLTALDIMKKYNTEYDTLHLDDIEEETITLGGRELNNTSLLKKGPLHMFRLNHLPTPLQLSVAATMLKAAFENAFIMTDIELEVQGVEMIDITKAEIATIATPTSAPVITFPPSLALMEVVPVPLDGDTSLPLAPLLEVIPPGS
ncbi:uncharacterized protein LOC122035953 [Zingiber officinale]|uniref:uncharacterized protein LOC122035953 n=1 Tax=Zingiber officinale TaxID=94328 RepID=UPI001C4AF905|nr:uncharacterized protein LOC122035953 [Zingiber officinale]